MTLKITILGCGHSAGVPSIGNFWGQCDPEEPRNRRTRPSIAVQSANTNLIVDTGPDFKAQINATDITRIDAVLYTHGHGDHVHGIDDLRVMRIRNKAVIPVYSNQATIEELHERFGYLFAESGSDGIYPQVIDPHIWSKSHFNQSHIVGDIDVVPFEQSHGEDGISLGFRMGNFAYSTDMTDLSQESLEVLAGVDTWVVDAGGYKMPHNYVHATLRDVYALNEIVQARQVYLTHMPSYMDYRTMLAELPEGYAPAYDGMVIEV